MNTTKLHRSFGPLGLTLALIAGLTVLPACRTVMADRQTNTIGRVKFGELQVFANRDFETVYQAAKAGLAGQKLFLTQDDKKYVEAELRARDAADTLIIVKIKEVARDRTSVKIRYGIRGDTPSAERLYSEIAKHL
jgi:hypothetical protein